MNMIKKIKEFLIRLFQPFIEIMLLRRIEQSRKEFREGKCKKLTSLEDLR